MSTYFPQPAQYAPFQPSQPRMDMFNTDVEHRFANPDEMTAARARAHRIKSTWKPQDTQDENTYVDFDLDNVPKSRDITNNPYNNGLGCQTIFEDPVTADFYRETLRPKTVSVDSTIPHREADVRAHVALLVKAYKSTNLAQDNHGMVVPFLERRHDSRIVECICWGIVKACIMRSESDEPLLSSYDPKKAKNNVELSNFAKRFDAIICALAKSKTICKHLYDAPFITTFVDDPLKAIKRVAANRDLNRQKAETMIKGKEAFEKEGKPVSKRGRTTKKVKTVQTRQQQTEVENQDTNTTLTPYTALPSQRRAISLSTPSRGIASTPTHVSHHPQSAHANPNYASNPFQSGRMHPGTPASTMNQITFNERGSPEVKFEDCSPPPDDNIFGSGSQIHADRDMGFHGVGVPHLNGGLPFPSAPVHARTYHGLPYHYNQNHVGPGLMNAGIPGPHLFNNPPPLNPPLFPEQEYLARHGSRNRMNMRPDPQEVQFMNDTPDNSDLAPSNPFNEHNN